MHGGFTRREPSWRGWVVVLALLLIGATSASAVWHATHDADQDCAVCQLRDDSAADLVGLPRIGPADAPRTLVAAPAPRSISAHRASRLPARAPPA